MEVDFMNNLKEKTYKAPYTVNACGLYLYKSNRKNAKTKDVMINHLIALNLFGHYQKYNLITVNVSKAY